MKLDDELCLCFHVTRRKVVQFIRVKHPEVASQLSECFGAGTGCGWCRPYLERIFQMENNRGAGPASDQPSTADGQRRLDETPQVDDLPDAAEYARSRSVYRAARQSRPTEP
ncbi:MAG: (2Fe-2S)-binding protein [Planctomycetaceae bacterium]